MAAIITNKGAQLIAQQQAAGQALIIKRFIFAMIEGLDPTQTPSQDEVMPSTDKIQYSQDITKAGYVNPAQVVYSVIVGSDVGDWSYNWIGLEAEGGELFAVAYLPTQQKVKNIPPAQLGNTITRNFLIAFDGAQSITQINIPAESWQFDITDKLDDMDARNQAAIRGIFGRSTFFNDAFLLVKNNAQYVLKKGISYIEGIRLFNAENLIISPDLNNGVWLDVFLQKENNIKTATFNLTYGDNFTDYTDSAGVTHHLIKIATLLNGEITDTRSRILKADSLLEAISDDPNSDPANIASIGALQKLKEDLITNNNAIDGNATLTKEQRGYICVSAEMADTVITLPEANAENKGVEFILMRTDNSDNMLKVQANATDKILFHLNLNITGYSHFELFGGGDFWHIYSTGNGTWLVMARNDASPLGVVQPIMAVNVPPAGYFPAMRFSFEMARFPWLYDFVVASNAQTTPENADNEPGKWVIDTDNNTIVGPNLQGEFIRGFDFNRGIDNGRTMGSAQADELKEHNHLIGVEGAQVGYGGTIRNTVGGRAEENTSIRLTGGKETRPRNIAYLYIFKAI